MDQTSPQEALRSTVEDDVWVPSSCSLCYATCSIKAHRVDGVVVKIEGNPDSVVGKGRLCGKGAPIRKKVLASIPVGRKFPGTRRWAKWPAI